MWTAAGEYRLLIGRMPASTHSPASALLSQERTRLQSAQPDRRPRTVATGRTWADRIVGLKGRYSITPQLYLTGWGLVGGGASADITWDVLAGAGYEFTQSFSAVVGYRASGVDYTNGGFTYDVRQQGPIIGAVFRFFDA